MREEYQKLEKNRHIDLEEEIQREESVLNDLKEKNSLLTNEVRI